MEKLHLGAQMYTLREYCATPKLFDNAIDRLAEIGYKYVQFSGEETTVEARVAGLARNNLKCGLTHWDDDEIINNTQLCIENHNKLGADGIGIGGIRGDWHTIDGYNEFFKKYGKAIEEIGKAGKCFCYHNHWYEFARHENGKTGMEMLLENSDPNAFKLTLDTAWAHRGGIDCVDFIHRYHDRIYALHLKDYTICKGEITLIEMLDGNLNFKGIIEACMKYDIKNLYVEQDFCRRNVFESLRISRENLLKAFPDVFDDEL